MVKSKRLSALAIVTTMVVSVPASAGSDSVSLNAFLTTYRCSLARLIEKIVAHDPNEIPGRFIVLSLSDPEGSYVQCLFGRNKRDALCEASSGWWDKPSERPHFGASQLDALARLGFSTNGSHGNFKQVLNFPPGGPDPYVVADLMLSALYEIYGARMGMVIEVEAPFALEHGFLPQQRCVPIS